MGTALKTQIEQHLWQSMSLLRGNLPVEDQLELILSLIVYKWLTNTAKYTIPEESSWSSLRKIHRDLGSQLKKGFRTIEQANNFPGLFYSGSLTELSDSLLEALISTLDQLNLAKELVSAQQIGYECLKLTERIMDASRNKGNAYIPQSVARLIANISNPNKDSQIYDPCFNMGELLNACLDCSGASAKNIYGEEISIDIARLAKLLLFIRGGEMPNLQTGNSLRSPAFTTNHSLKKFDRIVSAPRFGMREWGYEQALADPFNRFQHGIPPKTKGELAYIQHSLAALSSSGIACLLFPAGCLFRLGAEEAIRRSLLEFDLLEASIALPNGLLPGTSIAATILVFNRSKESRRRNKILFIDASQTEEVVNKKERLNENLIELITKTYRNFETEDGFSAVLDNIEVINNGSDFSPGRFVQKIEPVTQFTLEDDLKSLKEAEQQRKEVQKGFEEFLDSLGY